MFMYMYMYMYSCITVYNYACVQYVCAFSTYMYLTSDLHYNTHDSPAVVRTIGRESFV